MDLGRGTVRALSTGTTGQPQVFPRCHSQPPVAACVTLSSCERECGVARSAGVCHFLQASRCLPALWKLEISRCAFPKVLCSWGSAYELGAVQFFYVGEIRGRSSVETIFSSPLGCFCCRVISSRWRPPCLSICVRFLEVSGSCGRGGGNILRFSVGGRSGGFPILLHS